MAMFNRSSTLQSSNLNIARRKTKNIEKPYDPIVAAAFPQPLFPIPDAKIKEMGNAGPRP